MKFYRVKSVSMSYPTMVCTETVKANSISEAACEVVRRNPEAIVCGYPEDVATIPLPTNPDPSRFCDLGNGSFVDCEALYAED